MLLEPDDPLAIAYVDLNTMQVTLNNGDTLPITEMLDDHGDDCGADDAVLVIAGDFAASIEDLGCVTLH